MRCESSLWRKKKDVKQQCVRKCFCFEYCSNEGDDGVRKKKRTSSGERGGRGSKRVREEGGKRV